MTRSTGSVGAGRVLNAELAFHESLTGVMASDHIGLVVDIRWPDRPLAERHAASDRTTGARLASGDLCIRCLGTLGCHEVRRPNRSHTSTNAEAFSGSNIEWPARVLTISSASGHLRCRSHAERIGQITS